ncbi:MAG: radical SAM protein [Candidatus Nanoarchaeia archaeon]|nr:radical SAM protein [Candidatus Nanoarchaeia archaeon]MDD5587613.1 radical SAM protein [Candidatus Nanoarchaeia archaeon]
MKVILVKPYSNIHVILPAIGLGYLATYCKSKIKNLDIKILDCLKEKYDSKKFAEYIIKENPDVVGITAFTLEINSALEYAKICKAINKEITTVIGGPHVSNVPEQVLCNENVDYVFVGEAELGFCKFLQSRKDLSKIPGLGYKKNNRIYLNNPIFIQDLDELPFPDYELLKFREYPKMYFMKKFPSGPILTSRGCPFSCTFCCAGKLSGKKFRFRSPENIIKEIKYLKYYYGIKEFQIWDDNFSLDRNRALKFCNLLIQENINLPWWCPNGLRIETLDEELLRKMKQSGCYAMAVGIESGSEKIQKDMKKFLNLEKAKEIVKLAEKLGIRTQGFFIIGYPTETKEDILQTIKIAKKFPFKRASFSLFQPLVGSEIYYDLKKQGRLAEIDLNKCEYSKPSLVPQGLKNEKELKKLQRKAILSFYLRPKILIRFIFENLSISQLKEILVMFKKYIMGK